MQKKRKKYPQWMASSYSVAGAIAISWGWPQWNGELNLQDDGFGLLVVGVGFLLIAVVMWRKG